MSTHTIAGRKVVTDFWMKPIPPRHFDWSAIFDDSYCGCPDCHEPIGHGATEADAIADLIENAELRDRLTEAEADEMRAALTVTA